MITIFNNIKRMKGLVKGAMLLSLAAPLAQSCSDEWNDHYEGTATNVNGGTLWQAIQGNSELSNFAKVMTATGYDKSLDGSQVFTVFAPTNANFTETQANDLIESYKLQKANKVNTEDNTVIKEFVQNHIALYNHSTSSLTNNDTIVLMNGKYATLNSDAIDNAKMLTKNQLYGNGVLYTVDKQVDYLANLFEYVRKDSDLDSLRTFLYSGDVINSGRSFPLFYYREFLPNKSVAGEIDPVTGRTTYLDSVFQQYNNLYSYIGRIAAEDSTLWMLAPTNHVWDKLIKEYEPYFNYASDEPNRDSLAYTMPRLAIMAGTVFSRSENRSLFDHVLEGGAQKGDSAISVNGYADLITRRYIYGAPFSYYVYHNTTGENSLFNQTDVHKGSNGMVRKVTGEWPINKLQTFFRCKIIEAEAGGSIKEVSKAPTSKGDSVSTISGVVRYALNDKFDANYKVWNGAYVEFVPNIDQNHSVTFNIKGVLSNIGYDIYLVTAPALANDSNATATERTPTNLRCSIEYKEKDGKRKSEPLKNADGKEDFPTIGDEATYLKLAEDFKFPVCTYGTDEDEAGVTLTVRTRVTSSQITNDTYTRTMRIDCILLVPHETLEMVTLPDNATFGSAAGRPGVMMYPHGKDYPWSVFMLR